MTRFSRLTNLDVMAGLLDHDLLLNYVANEHIDWTNTTENLLTTGTGRFDGGVGVGVAPAVAGFSTAKGGVIESTTWTYFTGDIDNLDAGFDIAVPTVAAKDFFYGFSGTAHHKFGNSSQVEISDDGLITAVSLAVDTTTLVVDDANDRVGIGTATPSFPTHIIGNDGEPGASPSGNGTLFIGDNQTANNGGVLVGYHNGASGYGWLQSYGGLPLQLNPVGNNIILNRDSGNVGIGLTTVDANYKLIIRRAANINLGIGLQSSELAIAAFNDALSANIPMRFYASEFNLLNGNVGINETVPQDKLEVNGTVLVKDKLKFTQDDGNEYIDSTVDGADSYMVYGATTAHRFNATVEVAAKIKLTSMGGYAIKLTNTTGAVTVAGQVVRADTTTNDAVILTGADEFESMGIFLDSGVADDAEAWVVVFGIADVAMEDNTTATRGNWVRTSITEAGYADATIATPPGAGIPEIDQHLHEIGHCIETVTATGEGTHILARCVIHWN